MLKAIPYLSTAVVVATIVIGGTTQSQTVFAQAVSTTTTTSMPGQITVTQTSMSNPAANAPVVNNTVTSSSVLTVSGQPAPTVTEPSVPSFFGSSQIILPTIPGFTAAGVAIAPVNSSIVVPGFSTQMTLPTTIN